MRFPVLVAAALMLAACSTEMTQTPAAVSASTAPAPAMAVAPAAPAAQQAGMLGLVNAFRASEGRPPVSTSAALTAAATAHAQDMVANGYFSHSGQNGSTVGSRTRAAGCSWTGVAENIAQGQTTPEQAMQTWVNSSGHRANLLGNYSQVGDARVGNTWVLVFASGC